MKENKQYRDVSSCVAFPRVGHTKIDRGGWVDNRPQSIAQAHLIDSIRESGKGMFFSTSDQKRSIQKKSSPLLPKSDSVIQAALYLRGLQQGAVHRDKEWLERTELAPEDDILFKRHFQGLLASLTRYNEGQKFYYSPVGYIVEIENDEKIFANFSTDGSTGDLQQNHLTHQFGLASVDAHLLEGFIRENSDLRREGETEENYTTRMREVKKRELALLMRQYGEADHDDKNALIKDMLKLYYTIPGVVSNPLGAGLNPEGLSAAETVSRQSTSDDLKYTETKAAIVPTDLKGAYYNDNQEERADWRKSEGSHKKNATEIKDVYGLNSLYKIDGDGKLVRDIDA